ncbi:acyl-CoA thioesterase II [Burkholderia pseudomultivorans]|uniref:Acyl-CoA thioesterase II n=2 Tax=Burkholderia pseudomultivorans TaxID=1207504 RepID=A0A132EJX2_9BURK|nr:acyl-CoA thioesterase II [Burkholderia pseudomultivorans]
MRNRLAMTVSDLLALLHVRPLGDDRFVGHSPVDGARRVYGGQLLAQSIMAMGQTVRDTHRLHSMQGYFLQPGDVAQPLAFSVEPLREGRNFSTRAVRVTQQDRAIFHGAASFQIVEGDHTRADPMPAVPGPERMQAEDAFYAGERERLDAPRSHVLLIMDLFERRSDGWRPWVDPGTRPPVNGIWSRLRAPCGSDPLLCHALLAYVCDLDLMSTAMRPRGHGAMERHAKSASLDHAMWFHAPVRPDQWFYYDLRGPCATNNRGLGAGALYQGGRLVATVMQEGLMRINEDGRHADQLRQGK